MSFDAHANFAYSTVLTAPSPATSGTSLVVQSGDGALFPAVPFNAVVWPAGTLPLASNAEIVRVTSRTTDTLTITRTQESTSARSIGAGDQIAATITAQMLAAIESAVPVTYTVTTADADNTASNTSIFSITVPANTWPDGGTIYFEAVTETKQNSGGAVNLTFGGSYAGNSAQATASSIANSATLAHSPVVCSVTRIGTSLYFYRGGFVADLMTTVSSDQYSGIRGFILTGQTFTANSTLTIDMQWGSANALTFYRILGAARAWRNF